MNKIKTVEEYRNLITIPGKHIVKVSASWCGPCRTLSSMIQELDDELKQPFIEIDVDEAEPDLVDLLHVRNIPLLIFYKGSEEVLRTVGGFTKDELLNLINDTYS